MRISIALIVLAMVTGAVLAQPVTVRPGDTLNISVLGEDKLTGKSVVGEDGTIALPLAGTVKVEGLTAAEVTTRLTERLAEYVKDPQVTVEFSVRAPVRVTVSGEVKSPGIQSLPPDGRLADALAAAGGVGPQGDLSRITLVRSGDKPLPLDFRRFLTQGDETQNPLLVSTDNVIVGKGPQTPDNACQILGQVTRPGAYEVVGAVTPWDLVAKAGGCLPGANLEQSVLRPVNGQARVINMNDFLTPQGMAEAPLLSPGDTLVIPGFTTKIYVMGGVKTPGPLMVQSDARLLDAIAAAGGLTETARPEQAYVLRVPVGETKATRIAVDLRKVLTEGDMSANLRVRTEDTIFIPVRGPQNRSWLERAVGVLGPLAYILW